MAGSVLKPPPASRARLPRNFSCKLFSSQGFEDLPYSTFPKRERKEKKEREREKRQGGRKEGRKGKEKREGRKGKKKKEREKREGGRKRKNEESSSLGQRHTQY